MFLDVIHHPVFILNTVLILNKNGTLPIVLFLSKHRPDFK
jgi:hypothetical protein